MATPSAPLAHASSLAVAEAVREACRTAVVEAWEDAGVQGLCVEGRIEVAVGAIERLDLGAIVAAAQAGARPPEARPQSAPASLQQPREPA